MRSPHHHENLSWQHLGLPALRLRPRSALGASFMGYALSLAIGLGALKFVVLGFTLLDSNGWSQYGSQLAAVFAWSQLACIPFGMGVLAAYFWIDEREIGREANDRPFDMRGSVLLNTILAGAGAWFISVEVVPLLIVAAPLICFGMWLGTRTGQVWWRNHLMKS